MTNTKNSQQINDEIVKLAAKEILNRLRGNKDDETGSKMVAAILFLFDFTKSSLEVFSKLENILLLLKEGKNIEENILESLIENLNTISLTSSDFLPFINETIKTGSQATFQKENQPRKGFSQPKKKHQIKNAEVIARQMQAVFDSYIEKRNLLEKEHNEQMEDLYKKKEGVYKEQIELLEQEHIKHTRELETIYKEHIASVEKRYDQREIDFQDHVSKLMSIYEKHTKQREQNTQIYMDTLKSIFEKRDKRLREKIVKGLSLDEHIRGFCQEVLKDWDVLSISTLADPLAVEPLDIVSLNAFLDCCFFDRPKNDNDIKQLLEDLNKNYVTLDNLIDAFLRTRHVLFDYEKESFSYYSSIEYQAIALLDRHPHPTKWSHFGIVAFMLQLVNDRYFDYRKSIVSLDIVKETEYFRKKLQDFCQSNLQTD